MNILSADQQVPEARICSDLIILLEFSFCWHFDCSRDYVDLCRESDCQTCCRRIEWISAYPWIGTVNLWNGAVHYHCSINLLLSWQISCEDAIRIFLAPTENRQWKFYEKDCMHGNKHWEDKKIHLWQRFQEICLALWAILISLLSWG